MITHTPYISIILPAYNVSASIGRCINSIQSQSFDNFELIIIDDGSDDHTLEICQELAKDDPRLRVIHQAHGGVCSARNLGLDNVSGDILFFIDGDDYVGQDYLQSFVDRLLDTDPSVMLVEGMIFLGVSKKRIVWHYDKTKDLSVSEFLQQKGYGYLMNKAFRTSEIKKRNLRFLETIKCHEDEIFVLDYLQEISSILVLPEAHYYYFEPENFDKKYSKHHLAANIQIYQKAKELLGESASATAYLHKTLLYNVVVKTIQAMRTGVQISEEELEDTIKTVKADIHHIKGRKRLPLKLLHFTNSKRIWTSMFKFYSHIE